MAGSMDDLLAVLDWAGCLAELCDRMMPEKSRRQRKKKKKERKRRMKGKIEEDEN